MEIKFINHASVLVTSNSTGILSDPWYFGKAFNDGWSLISSITDLQIKKILHKTSFIYISHEHPDHLSIAFFLKYKDLINKRKIVVLFQNTNDKRVINFLHKLEINTQELFENEKFHINDELSAEIIKNGFLDSSLIIENNNNIVINLNDCDFSTYDLKRISKKLDTKKKIVLLNQFSYAAYRSSDEWLKKAAEYKLANLKKTFHLLKADLVIPFASYIYFSHNENQHLNSFINTPEITHKFLSNNSIPHVFFKVYDKTYKISELLNKAIQNSVNSLSINYWNIRYNKIQKNTVTKIHNEVINTSEISQNEIDLFLDRIKKNNNLLLLFLIRYLSFKKIFGDCFVSIKNFKSYKINFFKIMEVKNSNHIDIEISIDSFKSILVQPWGLDTLTVNGRLTEVGINGFRDLIFSIGFVALNSSGFGINFVDFFKPNLLYKFLSLPLRIVQKNS